MKKIEQTPNSLRQILPTKSKRTEIEKLVVYGKELCDKQDIADSLNEYFTTIASSLLANRPSPDVQPSGLPNTSSQVFEFHTLRETDVFKAFRTMDPTKATGADKIPAKALKIAAPNISQVLTKVFNASYSCGRWRK